MKQTKKRTLNHITANLREVIYGGIDGIITTFAVVSGFSGAHLSTETASALSISVVLLFGFANLFADGVSMGLGNFLSLRSAQKLYRSLRAKEEKTLTHNKTTEAEEMTQLLQEQNFSRQDAETLITIFQKNTPYWLDFLMRNKVDIPNTEKENAVIKSCSIFFAFISFGAIPILPFLFITDPQQAFILSVIGVASALFLLALLRRIVIKENITTALFEVFLIGTIAGSIAFFVGSLFHF